VRRRRWLTAAGIGTVLFFLAMVPSDTRMKDSGGPGIVPFELAGSQDRADEIMAEWGEDGRDAARESLWIDFGFMLFYGAFLSLAAAAIRELARGRDWRRLASVGRVAVYFGALAAAFDALENVCLLLTLGGHGSAFPTIGTTFTACKFLLLVAALAYLAAGLGTWLLSATRARRGAHDG